MSHSDILYLKLGYYKFLTKTKGREKVKDKCYMCNRDTMGK